jgi:hypothetical protein
MLRFLLTLECMLMLKYAHAKSFALAQAHHFVLTVKLMLQGARSQKWVENRNRLHRLPHPRECAERF